MRLLLSLGTTNKRIKKLLGSLFNVLKQQLQPIKIAQFEFKVRCSDILFIVIIFPDGSRNLQLAI